MKTKLKKTERKTERFGTAAKGKNDFFCVVQTYKIKSFVDANITELLKTIRNAEFLNKV